ncbi:MAG TPA: hypothetical protein VF772_16465 [Terriglobales bacterium]
MALAAGLLGDYMVSVYLLTALTLVGILRDWRRKGWGFVVQQRPQYALDFVGYSILIAIVFGLYAIVFSIMTAVWRVAHWHS